MRAVRDHVLDHLADGELGVGKLEPRRVLVADPHDARVAVDDDRALARLAEALEQALLGDPADGGGILEAASLDDGFVLAEEDLAFLLRADAAPRSGSLPSPSRMRVPSRAVRGSPPSSASGWESRRCPGPGGRE
jgi:hypothetical protein